MQFTPKLDIQQHPRQAAAAFLAIGFVLGAGVVFGGKIALGWFDTGAEYSSSEVRQFGYRFISPLLECEIVPEDGFSELAVASSSVRALIEDYTAAGVIEDAAVYFRDLNNGPWFGINERALFAPASLYKVPLMVSVFKKAELEPGYLDSQILHEGSILEGEVSQNIDPEVELEVGKSYSILELTRRMIQYSDNEAMALISLSIDEKITNTVESEMGLQLEQDEFGEFAISVKAYAGIFRRLYNASYLTRARSEQALEILSGSRFTQGIPAALPEKMQVSHKFGERVLRNADGSISKQLHDCGIVYNGSNPYLLCIMTRGTDLQQQLGVIRAISATVYKDAQTHTSQ